MARRSLFSALLLSVLFFCYHTVECKEVKATIRVPKDFSSVSKAVENAKEGDIISIADGEYDEPAGLKLKAGIHLVGAGADKTKIILGATGVCAIDIANDRPGLKDISMEGITFQIKKGSIILNSVEGFILQNCVVTGDNSIYGIYISSSNKVQINNCTIDGMAGGIIFNFRPVEVTIRNSIISNNIVYGMKVAGAAGIPASPLMTDEQIEKIGKGTMTQVKLTLLYNDVWGSPYGYNYVDCQPGKFDISKDPKYVDEKKPDYHLRSDSPCVAAGDPDPKYSKPDGSKNDIGALPYVAKK